jgi:hypothetical protein
MDAINVNAQDACVFFEHVVEYQVAVCQECRHRVVPSHIASHLRQMHKVEHNIAKRVAEVVYE